MGWEMKRRPQRSTLFPYAPLFRSNFTSDSSFLDSSGWLKSYAKKQPVDKDENPIPWTTFGYIFFIEERLNEEMSLFEFGSGNSTSFYSKRVGSVTSVEHDYDWFNKIQASAPKNVLISYQELERGGSYCKFALRSGTQYDIIIVDGRDRVNCCINSVDALSESGVIVLDDSERKKYSEAIQFLKNQSFKKIDFWGMAPGISFNKCTSIFYREENCLGI